MLIRVGEILGKVRYLGGKVEASAWHPSKVSRPYPIPCLAMILFVAVVISGEFSEQGESVRPVYRRTDDMANLRCPYYLGSPT